MADTVQAQAEQMDMGLSLTEARALTFQGIAALLCQDLPSESSRRVYRHTFQQWEQFAAQNNFDFMDLSCENINSFLFSRNLSHSTRISRKSHMQSLLRMMSYLDPSFGILYVRLLDLNIRRTSRDNAPRRPPRVLSRDECQQLLAVWKNEETHMGVRNYAVICLLLYTAIRNAELVALRWEDLNWDAQTLTICRGKEGQRCNVPIRDPTSETRKALRRLQDTQRSVFVDYDIPYKHIFPALSTGKEARFKPDKDVRTSTQSIRNTVKRTGEKAGLGNLTILDLHHTGSIVFAVAGAFAAGDPSSADSLLTRNGDSHETVNPKDSPSISAGNRACRCQD